MNIKKNLLGSGTLLQGFSIFQQYSLQVCIKSAIQNYIFFGGGGGGWCWFLVF